MSTAPWNHNIHYHPVVLSAVPPNCRRALDVGCGKGLLVQQLAPLCQEVIGVDTDRETLDRASAISKPGITFIKGDVMTYPFEDASFDLITAVAALHHLPLKPALTRFRDLLKPGGVLAVVGLYRRQTLPDFLWDIAAVPVSRTSLLLRGYADVGAPVQDPKEGLREIRTACETLLPGAIFRRRLLFRYSLVWKKPVP